MKHMYLLNNNLRVWNCLVDHVGFANFLIPLYYTFFFVFILSNVIPGANQLICTHLILFILYLHYIYINKTHKCWPWRIWARVWRFLRVHPSGSRRWSPRWSWCRWTWCPCLRTGPLWRPWTAWRARLLSSSLLLPECLIFEY